VNILKAKGPAINEDFSDCKLKPKSFVFFEYDDIKDFLMAIARGEDGDFLYQKYEPPAKVTINGELVLSVGPSCCNL
jgi:hypothetical protein